jgi:hypothetical protein
LASKPGLFLASAEDFEGELLQQGYAPSTVRKQKKLFADLSDWLQTKRPRNNK